MNCFSFLLNMWIMRRITKEQLNAAVTKGYITQEEANEIKTHQQIA